MGALQAETVDTTDATEWPDMLGACPGMRGVKREMPMIPSYNITRLNSTVAFKRRSSQLHYTGKALTI